MADSNNVFILFEEIKTALNGIKSKLEELPNVASQQHRIGNDKLDLSPIKETVTETAKAQSEEIKGLLEKQWKAFSQLSTLILHQLDAIKKSQEEQGEQQELQPQDPQAQFRHKVKQGLFLCCGAEYGMRFLLVGQYRTMAVQAAVCR